MRYFYSTTKYMKESIEFLDTRELNAAFGTSLLLANSPMSPKIVDGSFAAIRDYGGLLTKFAETFNSLQIEPKDSPGVTLSFSNSDYFYRLVWSKVTF